MTTSKIPLEPTLPRGAYLDAAAFVAECAKIFRSEWFCTGRGAELAAPGDFRLHRLAGENVIVTRDRGGQLRAFHDVCRHRGTELVSAPDPESAAEIRCQGRFPGSIRCPYHGWTYELDGALRSAPWLDGQLGECKSALSLHPVGTEEWGGFYFLNLDSHRRPGTKTLAAQLGPIPARIARYSLEELRVGHSLAYDVGANWKVILENYNECYHCGPVHPELCEVVPAFRVRGGAGLDWDSGIPHRPGADTYSMTGTSTRASFPGLNEDERVKHKGELIYPNLMLSLAREHAAAFRLWPVGPERTWITCEFLFHPDEIAKADFDPSDTVRFWDITNRQDWDICERVQRGMHSLMFEHGYYAPMEDLSLDIRRYVSERLARE
ncbi:MAG: aromatic ring-hydroxylating dioxygenase subunit alpha [Gammaproteobacteria bacterium]|nr:aromatic ring-hydroxylating dioxygenase subunit alpha [Gammaproteobacteria bacterium]